MKSARVVVSEKQLVGDAPDMVIGDARRAHSIPLSREETTEETRVYSALLGHEGVTASRR